MKITITQMHHLTPARTIRKVGKALLCRATTLENRLLDQLGSTASQTSGSARGRPVLHTIQGSRERLGRFVVVNETDPLKDQQVRDLVDVG